MKRFLTVFLFSFLTVTICFGYSISLRGRLFIQKFENCKLTRYWDGDGYSIGWGHHFKKGENYRTISMAKANQLFNKDIAQTNAYVNWLLKPFEGKCKFNQRFIDGIGDLVFNCGVGSVKYSTFYKRLKKCRIVKGKMLKKDLDYAIAAVKSMNITAKGHVKRRKAVHDMMRAV